MGVARIFGVCATFLFASSVAASTIDVGPSNWRNYGPSATHTGGGVQSTFGQNVRLPPTVSGPTRILPVSRNAVIPYGSIANGARNFLRVTPASVAASAAVTGLFMAMDWYFDQDMGEWVRDAEPALEDPEFGLWYSDSTNASYPTPDAACSAVVDHLNNRDSGSIAYDYGSYQITSDTGANCRGDMTIVSNGAVTPDTVLARITRPSNCPANYSYQPTTGLCVGAGLPTPITNSDISELESYLPNAPAVQVGGAASDIQRKIGNPLPGYTDSAITGPSSVSGPTTTSTSTDPVTGDTTVTETSSQTHINYGDTTITTTTTTTSTTYQNGQETSTTVETETPGELPVSTGGGAAGDWPGFCEWASVVCDWFNWTQEEPPPEQDLPSVIDDDFYQEKTISFGAKSCPPDHQIDLAPFLATSVAVSFQPLCDFAGLIYYMVMAASYIIAAYITIGVARNG